MLTSCVWGTVVSVLYVAVSMLRYGWVWNNISKFIYWQHIGWVIAFTRWVDGWIGTMMNYSHPNIRLALQEPQPALGFIVNLLGPRQIGNASLAQHIQMYACMCMNCIIYIYIQILNCLVCSSIISMGWNYLFKYIEALIKILILLCVICVVPLHIDQNR